MSRRTDILELLSRKLAPFMFLYGLYLITYGDRSPGGGFQGGVVVASGIILIALGHTPEAAQRLVSRKTLSLAEAFAFVVLLVVASAGVAVGVGFLGDVLGQGGPSSVLPRARFIWVLNMLIGLKVGAGASLIFLALLGADE